jgi:hypothetical protein
MSRADYLTLAQLRESRSEYRQEDLNAAALRKAVAAVHAGRMWAVRPAMAILFDGICYRPASHFHRIEAAVLAGSPYCEFWCDIKQGTKQAAIDFSRKSTT